MVKIFTCLLPLLSILTTQDQPVVLSPVFQALTAAGAKTPVETTVTIGKQFLGRPYVSHTLDLNLAEQLVVNTQAFDCTTYLETVIALSLAWRDVARKPDQPLFEQTFRKYLTKLRYRNGQIDGYASRLHYFSDWLRDNERQGILLDVTGDLPGSMFVAKPLSYMTATTRKYPRLSDPAIFRQVAKTEALLSQQCFSFLPKKNIRQAEPQIHEGDIVMLTASRPGLDMKHVGIAVRQPDGRMYLMHASSEQRAVVISPYPLSEYVLAHKYMSGIRVARLRTNDGAPTVIARGQD